VDAGTIDLTLQGRRMTAKSAVKTTLRARPDNKLPGLLKDDQGVNVNAEAFEYQGAGGKAVYTGSAALWQGDTAIRGNVITLDQEKGDLIASGAARSTLLLDMGTSDGTAAEIRYDDGLKRITYRAAPPVAPATAVAPAAQPHLIGSQGDVRADRIEITLGEDKQGADTLEAYTNVSVRVDTRVATGARLTFFSEDERYLLAGAPNVGVTVVDQCRVTTGKTLTFFKSTDRIIVDGNEEIRTQTKRGGPCPAPPAR
jgi:lipopolysaccharide export system protein LptA